MLAAIVLFVALDAIVLVLVLRLVLSRNEAARRAALYNAAETRHRVVTEPRPGAPAAGNGGRLARTGLALCAIALALFAVNAVREQPGASDAEAPIPEPLDAAREIPRQPAGPAAPDPVAPDPAPTSGPVTLSLSRDFRLVPWQLPARSTEAQHALTSVRPRSVRRAPRARDLAYGTLVLGPQRASRVFAVANDPDRVRVWVDADGDGDLTNDSAPFESDASAFGFAVHVPTRALYADAEGVPEFELWLFRTERGLASGRVGHYSRTQARGVVRQGNRRYDAWLVDQGSNDGDLTNDGIFVDIDGDGRIDQRFEYAAPGRALDLDGRRVRFRITP